MTDSSWQRKIHLIQKRCSEGKAACLTACYDQKRRKKLYGCDGKGRTSGSISSHKDRSSNVCWYMCVREWIYESSWTVIFSITTAQTAAWNVFSRCAFSMLKFLGFFFFYIFAHLCVCVTLCVFTCVTAHTHWSVRQFFLDGMCGWGGFGCGHAQTQKLLWCVHLTASRHPRSYWFQTVNSNSNFC